MTDNKSEIDRLDIAKLHSEANQLLNQRLTITTTAITVVCLVLAWFIPSKTSFSNSGYIGIFMELSKNNYGFHGNILYFGTTLLFVILVVLFWLSSNIKTNLMLITSYLIQNDKSNWEKYREKFNDKYKPKGKKPLVYFKYFWYMFKYPHLRVSQFFIFFILWSFVTIYPFVIQNSSFNSGCKLHCYFSGIGFIVLMLLRCGSNNKMEKIYKKKWEELIISDKGKNVSNPL